MFVCDIKYQVLLKSDLIRDGLIWTITQFYTFAFFLYHYYVIITVVSPLIYKDMVQWLKYISFKEGLWTNYTSILNISHRDDVEKWEKIVPEVLNKGQDMHLTYIICYCFEVQKCQYMDGHIWNSESVITGVLIKYLLCKFPFSDYGHSLYQNMFTIFTFFFSFLPPSSLFSFLVGILLYKSLGYFHWPLLFLRMLLRLHKV